MTRLKTIVLWSTLIIVVSFGDFSGLCRHGPKSDVNQFNYREPVLLQNATAALQPEARYAAYSPSHSATIPAKLTWQMLEAITFQKRWNKEYKMDVFYPVFDKSIKQYAGREMYITGYMIPLDIGAELYALSKNNYASCFFCGGAGVESIVSLKFKGRPRRYKTDEYLTVKGKLVLNDTNINDYVYIFQNAEEYKP